MFSFHIFSAVPWYAFFCQTFCLMWRARDFDLWWIFLVLTCWKFCISEILKGWGDKISVGELWGIWAIPSKELFPLHTSCSHSCLTQFKTITRLLLGWENRIVCCSTKNSVEDILFEFLHLRTIQRIIWNRFFFNAQNCKVDCNRNEMGKPGRICIPISSHPIVDLWLELGNKIQQAYLIFQTK